MVMRPLEGMDAAFLSLETPTTPMHVGIVLVLDPPEGRRSLFSPSTRYTQIRRVIEQRLHLVEQMRQRAIRVPFGLHHPVWVDDPDFELDDHFSRASLPSPGGKAELDAFVASVMSRQLDPDRPLWEMYVVEGLKEGRTALIAKIHHAILDGVSGASVLAAFMDMNPRSRVVPLPPEWTPAPLPSNLQLLRHAATALSHQPGATLKTLQAGIDAVADLGMNNRELVGRGEQPPPGFFGGPRTSFNGAVSNRKRFCSLSVPLEDVKLVGRAFEATVNDVLLACVSGALRRLLEARGEALDKSLVAMVPVSTRAEGAVEELGNQISGMLVSLASDIDDPVLRLDAISESARVAKQQEKLHNGRFLGDLAQVAVPGAGGPGGAGRGRDPALRQDAPAGERDGLERARPRLLDLLRGEPGGGHVPGRTDGRGDRDERDGVLVSRSGVLRSDGMSATGARSGPDGGLPGRFAGRARGVRAGTGGGDGLSEREARRVRASRRGRARSPDSGGAR